MSNVLDINNICVYMNTKIKRLLRCPGVIVLVENERSIATLKGIFMIALNVDAVVVIQVKEQSV